MSVIKRKFGDTIRSRKANLQNREPIIKEVVYNLHLLSVIFATEQYFLVIYCQENTYHNG